MPDSLESSAWVAAGTGGAAGALYLAVKMWTSLSSMLRKNGAEGRVADITDDLLTKFQEKIDRLEQRCDTFAHERNEAVAKAAELSGRVLMLEQRVIQLEHDKSEAKRLLEEVESRYRASRDENKALREAIRHLDSIIKQNLPAHHGVAVPLIQVDDDARPEMGLPLFPAPEAV